MFFRGAWFTRFASASIGAERKVILSEVVLRRSLCRLGLHWATHATWPLACKHGATLPRSFREASANLPRNTPAVLVFLACCWQLLFEQAFRFLSQQHLFFYWNRFSEIFHARTETFDFIQAPKLLQTFREQIPSAKPSARFGAVHIFNGNVPPPTKLACGQKNRRSPD